MPVTLMYLFPRIALALSAFAVVILTAPVAVAFSISPETMEVTTRDLSPLALLVVEHFRAFVLAWWLFCMMAVVGSIGLLRKRPWAHIIWVCLVSLALLWSLAVVTSELAYLLDRDAPPQEAMGSFPSAPFFSAIAVIPLGLAMIGVLSFLLWKLLSPASRAAVRASG